MADMDSSSKCRSLGNRRVSENKVRASMTYAAHAISTMSIVLVKPRPPFEIERDALSHGRVGQKPWICENISRCFVFKLTAKAVDVLGWSVRSR